MFVERLALGVQHIADALAAGRLRGIIEDEFGHFLNPN
jgi:hypothetical protein